MKYYFVIIFVGLLFVQSAFGQDEDLITKKNLWQSRAEIVTSKLRKDAQKVNELDEALIYAKLAKLWLSADKNLANDLFIKSVDKIFFYSSEDIKSNNQKFLQATNQILKIISNQNPKQANRLIGILTDSEKITKENKNLSSEALIEFALQIVKDNPGNANEIGILAFKMGQPDNFYQLYWELRKVDSNLANKFIKVVLSSAISNPNGEIAANLKIAIFPETAFSNVPESIVSPNNIKIQTLDFLANYLQRQQIKFTNKSIESCSSEASLISPLQNQFADLLPLKEPVITQAIATCLSEQTDSNRKLSSTGVSQSAQNSVEELLKLADEADDDLGIRTYYLLRAVSLANDKKQYKIATKILEDMNQEERESDLEFWETLRYTVASGFAYQLYKEQDVAGAIERLNDVPLENRAFAKVGFVLKFSAKDLSARSFCLERIQEAEKEFIKSEKTFAEKSDFWFQIIKIYSNYDLHTKASETFEEIVKEFNKDNSENPKSESSITSVSISSVISPELLEIQDNFLFQTSDLINDKESRLQVNLAFLEISIKQFENYKKKISELPKQKIYKQ